MVKKIFSIISIVYLSLFIAHSATVGKSVYGDGIYYFSWLRSAVADHDLNFRNEYEYLGGSQIPLTGGLPGNKYTIGPALIWFPVYFTLYNIFRGSGLEPAYQYIIGIYTVILVIVSLYIIYRLLKLLFSAEISILTVLTIAFATNLLFYGSLDPINSHSLTFIIISLYLYILIIYPAKHWFIKGLIIGFAGTIRPDNLIYILLMFPQFRFSSSWKTITGILLMLIPQLIIWTVFYGSPLSNPYLTSEGFPNLFRPQILRVMFMPPYGLFTWTPILLSGLWGLSVIPGKKVSAYKPVFLTIIALAIYLVASWSTWWQGASYGSRILVGLLPVFSIGIAESIKRIMKIFNNTQILIFSTILPLSVINIFAIIYFLLSN